MGTDMAYLVALVAAVLGPLVAYITAARKLSGKVATSEASELWEESRLIRDDYRQQLMKQSERMARLEARVTELETRNEQLVRENEELRRRAAEDEKTIENLRRRIVDLEQANAELEARVHGIQQANNEGKP